MKVLITGGAGFVGSHLAEALVERGDTVHVLDNLSTGSIENIEHLKSRPGFHYAIDSVMNERDRQAFAAALDKARQRQASIAPIDTTLPGNDERHLRFYVNAVSDDAGEGEEAAIVYAVDTTEQKALEGQMAQSQKM